MNTWEMFVVLTIMQGGVLLISKIRDKACQFHELQRRILDENPYAFYIHCFAHQLQLVVVSVAKCCSSVLDFFNYTSLIVNIVGASCKRKDQLLQAHHDGVVAKL